jgi:anaerobic selenocysteine-containing dehydrogenase
LRISPADAATYGVVDGSTAMLSTARGQATVVVEVTDVMQAGHVSLPNGMGLDEPLAEAGGAPVRVGTAPNELTDNRRRDPVAGTPWHKFVPARVEPLSPAS